MKQFFNLIPVLTLGFSLLFPVFAAAAVNWAGVNGIVRPVSGSLFAPKENATRAQAADTLMNYDHSQSSNPNLTMRVYPIGKVTSDLSVFPDLPSRVEITFEIVQ